mmetsp:Transcript_578/g.650  ORF Transcript_578/g.650 Transcript_578/m.650 type:complete len:215 (-) Transcript_578:1857-2501(-)
MGFFVLSLRKGTCSWMDDTIYLMFAGLFKTWCMPTSMQWLRFFSPMKAVRAMTLQRGMPVIPLASIARWCCSSNCKISLVASNPSLIGMFKSIKMRWKNPLMQPLSQFFRVDWARRRFLKVSKASWPLLADSGSSLNLPLIIIFKVIMLNTSSSTIRTGLFLHLHFVSRSEEVLPRLVGGPIDFVAMLTEFVLTFLGRGPESKTSSNCLDLSDS